MWACPTPSTGWRATWPSSLGGARALRRPLPPPSPPPPSPPPPPPPPVAARMAHTWDPKSYDALPLPHERWGADVVARLRLTGGERVMDIGCGTGRDTELLLAALPHGSVVAVDRSASMLARLRERLAAAAGSYDEAGDGAHARVTVVEADVAAGLPIQGQVDAAMSVAALHWVTDHDAAFRNVAAVLRPGGRFVFECGGSTTLECFQAAVVAAGGAHLASGVWNFAGVEETRARLLAAGFDPLEVRLRPDPARLPNRQVFEEYISTVMLGAHLAALPTDTARTALVAAVADQLPDLTIDYVRLEVEAVRR